MLLELIGSLGGPILTGHSLPALAHAGATQFFTPAWLRGILPLPRPLTAYPTVCNLQVLDPGILGQLDFFEEGHF